MIAAEAVVFLFRYQLHSKKNKVDKIPQRKPLLCANQDVARCLSSCFHTDDYIDTTRPFCNSMITGSINTCKTRIINFLSTKGMLLHIQLTNLSEKRVKCNTVVLICTMHSDIYNDLKQVRQGHSGSFSRKCLMKL
jgi:hypothetical protein